MATLTAELPFCEDHRKRTFGTENEARLQLLRAQLLSAEYARPKTEARYFRCASTGGFHLTSWLTCRVCGIVPPDHKPGCFEVEK